MWPLPSYTRNNKFSMYIPGVLRLLNFGSEYGYFKSILVSFGYGYEYKFISDMG